jgi:predicted nucleotidyltransferase
MIINRVLDDVLSTYSSIAVLRALLHSAKGLTGREISRNALITPKSALIALSKLTDLKIVNRVIGGRDHHFSLNRKNYLVINGILPLLESENQYMDVIVKLLKKHLSKKCISIILFGSVARKEEKVDSDLDICAVVQSNVQLKEIDQIRQELFYQLAEKFGVTLGLTTFTQNEFRKKGLKGQPPISNIIKEGVLIFGKPIKMILHD